MPYNGIFVPLNARVCKSLSSGSFLAGWESFLTNIRVSILNLVALQESKLFNLWEFCFWGPSQSCVWLKKISFLEKRGKFWRLWCFSETSSVANCCVLWNKSMGTELMGKWCDLSTVFISYSTTHMLCMRWYNALKSSETCRTYPLLLSLRPAHPSSFEEVWSCLCWY